MIEAPPQSAADLRAELSAVRSASRTAADRRQVIESEIRTTASIPRLGELHEQWQHAVETQDAAHCRQRELMEKLAESPAT